MSGEVASLSQKRAAEADVAAVVGVKDVENRLVVRATNENPAATAQRVSRALARHPRLQGEQIGVQVTDGVARLTGSVRLRLQRVVAEQVAARSVGVQQVLNDLKVREPSTIANYDPYSFSVYPYDTPGGEYVRAGRVIPLSDREIRERIQGELAWNPLVDASQITVTVSAAVAVLEGRVGSRTARRVVVNEAYQGGALKVDDRLQVRE